MTFYRSMASMSGGTVRQAGGLSTRAISHAASVPVRRMPLASNAAVPSVDLAAKDGLPWPVVVFLVALVVPWSLSIGPLRLSPYRLVLLMTFFPALLRIVNGKAGLIRTPDLMVLLFSLWAIVCLAVVHGLETALQGGGILFVETAGAYLLARAYIRDAEQFRSLAKWLFATVLLLLPFGLLETLTGQKPLLQLYGTILPTVAATEMDLRWGLSRVQGPFEHPILFGVFCGSAFALTHIVHGQTCLLFKRWLKSGIVLATALLALSSGPISAIFGVSMLLAWDWLLRDIKQRWALLWTGVLTLCLAVYVYSGQSIARFYISHAPLFDSWSAYYRLLIWEHGSQTVVNHPLFGIGYNEYERPDWMAASVDMFWLNNAIMFGLPGGVLMAGILLSAAWLVSKRGLDDPLLAASRTGYLMTLAFFFIVGWTVHFWNGTYAFFLFVVASGLWIVDLPATSTHVSVETGPMRTRAGPLLGSRGDHTGSRNSKATSHVSRRSPIEVRRRRL